MATVTCLPVFLILLLPVVFAIKPKDELRKCYQGVFLENSKKTDATLTIAESKVCMAQLRYEVIREEDVVLPNGRRGNRRICQPSTIRGEVRPARDDEIMDRWNKVTDSPELKPEPINLGYEIELDDDAEERRQAEANGSITRRPTRPTFDDEEDSIIPAHCKWLPSGRGLKDNVTCYCYTDYCNNGNDAEAFMKLLLSNCYTQQQSDETDQQYEFKCPQETKNAISCLQKPVERALNAKPRPPVDVIRNSTGNVRDVTWNPDDEYQRKYTPAPPSTTTETAAGNEPKSTWKYIVIGVCSSLLLAAGIGYGTFLCIKMKRKAKRQQLEEEEDEEGEDDEEKDEEEGEITGKETTEMSENPSIFVGGSDETKKKYDDDDTSRSGILKGKKIKIPEFGMDDSGGNRLGGEASDSTGGGGSSGHANGGQKRRQQKGKKSNEGKGKKTNSKDKKGRGKKKGKSKEKKGTKKGKSKQKKTKTKSKGKKTTRGRKGKKKK